MLQRRVTRGMTRIVAPPLLQQPPPRQPQSPVPTTTAPTRRARYSYHQLTSPQRRIADAVFSAATRVQSRRLFYVHGTAGAGKSHLLITLHRELRARGFNVVTTAFTAAAAAELAVDATTAHRTFGITYRGTASPRFLGSPAEFALAAADVLLFDHVEYAHRALIEFADQRVRRLSGSLSQPFGDRLVVVLAADVANLSAVSWTHDFNAHFFRARSLPDGQPLLKDFACYLLDESLSIERRYFSFLQGIGFGAIKQFHVPHNKIVTNRQLAAAVFGDAIATGNYEALSSRVIMCAYNRQLRYWNQSVVELLPIREFFEFRALDSIGGMRLDYFREEYPRFSPKTLRLRAHTLLQLLRDAGGQPAATILRYICADVSDNKIGPQLVCLVESGADIGNEVRISLASMFNYGDQFLRLQFPVTIAFASTINKAAARRCERIGIDVAYWRPEFNIVYAALSRVNHFNGLRICRGSARSLSIVNNVSPPIMCGFGRPARPH